ncbi:class I SAM-dependent DNA methyltransferase [Marivivens marinus]|uniref:class I SAM-dependent DNA methyltransferase n=1 Tax=Marivivens marinus TaxID=3110173 RepID=UPI003B846340
MVDRQTLDVYARQAADYARLFSGSEPDADLLAFMGHLPKGGRVLDLGCGPATASAHMRAAGFDPDPLDASPEMVALANETHAISARVGTFDDVDATDEYDGVWANFSLLHAPRADLPRHLSAIHNALKPAGLFHIGMKTGTGEARDPIGRAYTYVAVDELHNLLRSAGFTAVSTREGTGKGLAGSDDPFVICLSRKG